MKYKTIDRTLRNVWMAVSKMYQEEAQKLDSTMATGFTLITNCTKLYEWFSALQRTPTFIDFSSYRGVT